jgi:hypothetical protein
MTAMLAVALGGCSEEAKEDAAKLKEQAADGAKELGGKAGEMAGKAGDKIKEGAKALSEQAKGFLGPIQEKIGGLDGLKDKPAELKKSVENLIAMIESKASTLTLPAGVQKTMDTLKEKLVALRDYLGGETKPEEIDAKVEDVKDTAADLK